MAIAIGHSYTLGLPSSDVYVCISLGGGTAPVLLNRRTGQSVTADSAAVVESPGAGVFSQISGAAISPAFAVGQVCKIQNPTDPGEFVSNLSFVVTQQTSSEGLNFYFGYLIDSSNPISSTHVVQGGLVAGQSGMFESNLHA